MSDDGSMTEAHRECERYAGNLEQALEKIRELAQRADRKQLPPAELENILDVIITTSFVKDDRRAI